MQVLEVLDQEVLEAPQCARLVESDCLQQRQEVSPFSQKLVGSGICALL